MQRSHNLFCHSSEICNLIMYAVMASWHAMPPPEEIANHFLIKTNS